MPQAIVYGAEARAKMYAGVKRVNDAVKVTLGPEGKCVVISQLYEPFYNGIHKPLRVSKDGVSVANSIQLPDFQEGIGQRLIQEAAQRTVEQAGDGTTTCCLLTEAIVREGLKYVDLNVNSQDIKKGIDEAVAYVIGKLNQMATPVGNNVGMVRQVATISANNDTFIGDLIAEAFGKIGRDGIIDITASDIPTTEVKISEGFKFDSGYLSPHFRTNLVRNESELKNPLILLYEKNILQLKQIEPAMQIAAGLQRPLLVICEDCDMEAFAVLAMNHIQKKVQSCVVKVPFFGDAKTEFMEDLAIATGATYISNTKGIKLENVKQLHLGSAAKSLVTKESTMIVSGGKSANYDDYMNELRMDHAGQKTEEEKMRVEKRISRLTGRAAVIHVGASTPTELSKNLDRVDDAVRAVRAAVAEGILPGGGTALIRAKDAIPMIGDEFAPGREVVRKVLTAQLEQLCENVGSNFKRVFKQVSKSEYAVGYNAKTKTIEDLIDAGVIDAAKVVRCALQNAASAAGNIIIAEAIICDHAN